MRSPMLILTAALLAGCGGRGAAPSTTPEPATRAPAAAAADPASLRYAPTSGRYRYEQQQHATQEIMGQVQESDATTTLIVSAAITPGDAGNLNAAITVDSAHVVTQAANPATPAMDALRGKTYRAVISTLGKTITFTPPDTMLGTVLSGEMFRDFLPTLPPSVTPGTAWTDTVVSPPINAQGMRVGSTSIRRHRVVGWEMKDGARALHITTVGSYTLTGEGEQGGSPLQLAGTGTATSDRYISAAGVYLGTTVSDSANVKVTVVSMGLEVPVRQTRRTTVTRLP